MKKIMLLILLLTSLPSFAQIVPQWVNVFGTNDYAGAWPEEIVSDEIGNTYILEIVTNFNAGENTCHDPHIRKINSAGQTQWKTNLGTIPCRDEGAFDLKFFQNNLYVYYSKIDSLAFGNNLYISKITTDGIIIWSKLLEKNFGGYYNEANAAIDKYGNSFVASRVSKSVKQITRDGTIKDSIKIFADGYQCYNNSVAVNESGKILINSFYSIEFPYKGFLSLCDSLGKILWTKPLPRSDMSSKVLFGKDNSYYEYSRIYSATGYSVLVNKFSYQGDLIWSKEFVSVQPDYFPSDNPVLLNTPDGNLILGYQAFFGGASVKKLNFLSGDTLWSFSFSSIANYPNTFRSLVQDIDGNVYTACSASLPNWANGNSFAITKLSTNGILLRKTFNDGVLQKGFIPYVLSLSPQNDVIISGDYRLYSNSYEHTGTIRYSQPVNITPNENSLPIHFSLSQNYPNPFNPNTVISFQLPVNSFINLKVYNIKGSEVSELVNENLKAGEYKINFDGSALPSGVYYYKLTSENFSESKKMILIK